jgi:predicted transcriptional regulator
MSKEVPRPTESEVRILGILWQRGPSTVKDVHQQFGPDTGYTTVLKLMQIMATKGLLVRDRKGKQHVYRPAAPQQRIQKRLIGDLIDRAFGGSVHKLLVAALSAQHASPQELAEIRKIIDEQTKSTEGGPS